jgi:hypothetical protein
MFYGTHAGAVKGAGDLLRRTEPKNTFVAIATESENRFNAEYLHDLLMPLSMATRGRQWSVCLLREQGDEESHVETLMAWTLQNGQELIERAELAAITLSRMFTLSNRRMRDRATKVLATLLSVRPPLAARIVRRFCSCNDDYGVERVLAAAYGAAR